MIKLSLLFNSSPSKPKSDPKIFPETPALLQPPPGSSCQVVHLFSAPQLAYWMAKGGGTSSLVCDDGGALLHGELVLVDGQLVTCCKRSIQPTPEGTTARGRLIVEKSTKSNRKEGERCKKRDRWIGKKTEQSGIRFKKKIGFLGPNETRVQQGKRNEEEKFEIAKMNKFLSASSERRKKKTSLGRTCMPLERERAHKKREKIRLNRRRMRW